jgi:hypothetical protein
LAKDPISRYLLHRTSRLERRARLRPMEASEVMDLAMRVYQNFGLILLKATALPALFCFAAIAFVLEFVLPSFGQTSHAGNTGAQVGEALGSLSLAIGVGGPLFLIGVSYASAVTVFLVADFIAGHPPSVSGAHAGARRALKRMLGLNVRELFTAWSGLLAGFAALAGSALLSEVLAPDNVWSALGGIVAILGLTVGIFLLPWILARHALAPAAICLEEAKVGHAIRRSLDLLRGTPWAPSGYGTILMALMVEVFLVLMIWIGASASLGLFDAFDHARVLTQWPVVGVLLEKTLQLFPFFLAVWTVIPVWTTTTTLLYYERRIRLEGYDILALAQEVWRTDRQSRFEL